MPSTTNSVNIVVARRCELIGSRRGFFASAVEWLTLPDGYIDWIWRLVGLCGISCGLYDLFGIQRTGGLANPFVVPSWRVGEHLLYLPIPPGWLSALLISAYFVSCLAMLAGARKKIFLLAPIAIPVYFGSMEGMLADYATSWLCMALLCHGKKVSFARRLIQVQLAICYACSVLQKVTMPSFLRGDSLAAFSHSLSAMNPFWLRVVLKLNPHHNPFMVLAWAVVLVEAFLCFALFLPSTRKLGTWVGIVFHAGLGLVMNWGVLLFVIYLIPQYLAFFDRRGSREEDRSADTTLKDSAREPQAGTALTAVAAFVLIIVWLAIPLRLYFMPEHPFSEMSLQDRRPWSYAMYVVCSESDPNLMQASYVDRSGVTRKILPVGRMSKISTDNGLYAMARYIRGQHPEAGRINIAAYIWMDRKWWQKKTLEAENGKTTIHWSRCTDADLPNSKSPGR